MSFIYQNIYSGTDNNFRCYLCNINLPYENNYLNGKFHSYIYDKLYYLFNFDYKLRTFCQLILCIKCYQIKYITYEN